MPVAKVTETLSGMWAGRQEGEPRAPSEFRASQMNLILHFGLKTTVEEALERFRACIEFAQQYPCRIIVLCPMGRAASKRLLQGKLFAQCFIGDDLRAMCSCEALMVGYPTRQAGFLSNQVSVWIENDLPTYHWLNRVPAERIRDMHMDFIQRCRRVIIDSSIEEPELEQLNWPKNTVIRDLALARILPVRQSLGQFLSSFSPQQLVRNLVSVEVLHAEGLAGEGRHLLQWCRNCLQACSAAANGTSAGNGTAYRLTQTTAERCLLQLKWTYAPGNAASLEWLQQSRDGNSRLQACLDGQCHDILLQSALSRWPKTLSEALFF